MQDFLSNIAAKALNPAQGVRPRPVSLFEPVRSTGEPVVTRAAIDEQTEERPGFRRNKIPETVPPVQHTRQAPELQNSITKKHAAPDQQRDSHSGPTGTSSAESPTGLSVYQPTDRPEQQDKLAPSIHKTLSVPVEQTEQTGVLSQSEPAPALPTVRQSPVPADIPLGGTPLPTESVRQQTIGLKPAIVRRPDELMPPSPSRIENERQATESPRLSAPSGAHESLAAHAPPVPTIQVTIGRIEVRATVPTRPAQKLQATAQPMNLDDYLSRSQGGGRR